MKHDHKKEAEFFYSLVRTERVFMAANKTKELVMKIWDGDYSVVASGENAPSREEVLAYGQQYGVNFPEDYVSHSTSNLSGLVVQVKEDLWPEAKEFDTGPFWTFCRGVYTFAFCDDSPDWLKIEVARSRFQDMGHQVIPVLKVWSDPNLYCYNQEGTLVKYISSEDDFEALELGWYEVLDHELTELSKRKARKLKPS